MIGSVLYGYFNHSNISNAKSVETFKDKEKYYLTNETFTEIQPIDMPNERNIQKLSLDLQQHSGLAWFIKKLARKSKVDHQLGIGMR